MVLHFQKTGRFYRPTCTLDAACVPGWRRMRPARSRGRNHLIDRRRGDAETALDVGFGGRPEVDARVGVDEGEILALGRREAGFVLRPTDRTRLLEPDCACNRRWP